MPNNKDIRFLRFGEAKKSTFEMSKEELKQVSSEILTRAKEKAFSRGLPIFYGKNEKVFAEYSTGKVEEVKS